MAIKDQSYAGLCEAWVEDVTGTSINGDTAYDSWQNFLKNKKAVVGLNGVQPGDLVYMASDPNSPYGTDGHVGIDNGGGNFTSATDTGVDTANIQQWAQTNNQQILGYVPRKNLQKAQGAGGGNMAGVNPNAMVKIKSPGGQQLIVPVSDLGGYGLSASNIPQSAYVNGAGAGSDPSNNAGSVDSSNLGSQPPPLNSNSLKNNVTATIDKPTQDYQAGSQNIEENAYKLQEAPLDVKIKAFAADKTLAPKVAALDAQNGMTLKQMGQLYGPYMDNESIIEAYDKNSKYGAHKEDLAGLHQMGFNNLSKGFQDKQDTISAITSARQLKQGWDNYVSALTSGDLGKIAATKAYYDSQLTIATDPSSNYGKLIDKFRNTLPSTSNPFNTANYGSDQSFKGIEDYALAHSGGYNYKSLGLKDVWQNQNNSSDAKNSGQSPYHEKLNINPIENTVNNAGDWLKGVMNLPGAASQMIKNPVGTTKQIASGLKDDLGQTTGMYMGKDGKVHEDVGQALTHDYNHPLDTASWLFPLLKVGKFTKLLKGTEDVGKAGEATAATGNIVKANPIQKVISRGTDLARGKGTKEYVSRNVGNKTTQNQLLNDENILSHPTQDGKIEATQRSINKYGQQIGDLYKNSKYTISGDNLNKQLDTELKSAGYDQKTIDFIKRYIGSQGNFNLAKGNIKITAQQAWTVAKKLEDNPPKMLKNPESQASYKDLAKTTAKIIRQDLSKNVKGVKDLNWKYETLKDFHDTLKPGTGIQSRGGLFSTVTGLAQDATEVPLNWLYKGMGLPAGARKFSSMPAGKISSKLLKDTPTGFLLNALSHGDNAASNN